MFASVFTKYFNEKNIIFFIGLILFFIFVCNFKDVAIMFFASFVIACSLNPIVDKMATKMKRTRAAILVLTVLFGIILAAFIPVCIISVEEIKNFAVSFPRYLDKLDDYILASPFFSNFDLSSIDFESMASSASDFSSNLINNFISWGKNISTAIVYLIVSVIIIFNMINDKEILKKFYLRVFPSGMRKRAEIIGDLISDKMGGYLLALLMTMVGVGFVMFIGLSLFKINYALLLALITGVLDIIPVIGPGLALVICIIATYQSGTAAIIAVICVFAVAQLVENNFVRPYVFGKFLNLHPIVIFLFLFITAETMGVVGVIFAPAVAALFSVLFEELYLKKLD